MNARADAVFIGEIKDVVKAGGRALHKVKIERSFDGIHGSGEVEVYSDQSSSCSFSMAKDQTYLIFATINEKTGVISTWYCSGTKLVTLADKELQYLESLKNAPNDRGILGGEILEYDALYKDKKIPTKPPEIDEVFLESDRGEVTVGRIDANGEYIFRNLKGGRYTVSLFAPERLISTDELDTEYFPEREKRKISKKVKVPGSGCRASEYFTFYVNGIISGRVLDPYGMPLKAMPVTVLRFEDNDDMPEKLDRVWTNDKGFYAIKGLPAARYLIGFEIANSFYVNSHFAGFLPVYFPNKRSRKDAIYIELGYNQVLRNHDISLFPALNKEKISGRVIYSSGQPAKNADATFYVRRKAASDRTEGGYDLKLDREGRFELEIYDQTEYWILARVYDSDEMENRKTIFSSKCYKITNESKSAATMVVVLRKGKNNCDVEKL